MFDIGFWELVLIFVVALLVVGPQRFPGMVRSAAYWIGRVRQAITDVKSEISVELEKAEQLKRLIDEQNELLRKNEQQFRETWNANILKQEAEAKALAEKQAALSSPEVVKPTEAAPQNATAAPAVEISAENDAQPIVRPRPVPASLTAPRPLDIHASAPATSPVAQAAKDETKS
ncbi:MAG: Sec-independent protein translocase protein TatB [Gammaproteobacteria bacterium]|nr:Sec-independent protein translocase protein TatB [Gammaproteobacteria bacterium]